jgi:hypothetical protein
VPYNGRKFNVVRREEYTTTAGEKKTKWVRVGAAFFEQDDTKAMLKIDVFSEPFYLFPQSDEPRTKDSGYGG